MMLAFTWSKLGQMAVALLLTSFVVVAPIVNAKERPPGSIFLVLPEAAPPPEVRIQQTALGGGRYLLELNVSEFVFTELCVVDAEARPVGHAHVHVDGEKVASAYHPIVEIGPLEPGIHTIDVVLRGQDHRPIIARNGLVQGSIQILAPPDNG